MEFCKIQEFVGMHKELVSHDCMDITDKRTVRVTDEQARELIRKITRCENVAEFQKLEIHKRDKFLRKLREKGLSIRQLSRLTGVSFSVVRNIK